MRNLFRRRRRASGESAEAAPAGTGLKLAVLCGALGSLAVSTVALAGIGFELPVARASLPAKFAGEALTVALAFTFPALAAGAYLGAKSLLKRFGRRSVWSVATMATALLLAVVLADQRPDLLDLARLRSLAGL